MKAAVAIDRTSPCVGTVREWVEAARRLTHRGRTGPDWRAVARRYAERNGIAIAMRADDAAVVFWKDGARVRQRTIAADRVRWTAP